MIGFIIRRLVASVGTLFSIATLIFLFLRMLPGDPAEMLLAGEGTAPSPEAVAALRHQLGLDQPLATQYLQFMGGLSHLDLGTSLLQGTSVSGAILGRLPLTYELMVACIVLSTAVAVPLGILAATERRRATTRLGRAVDPLISAIASLGVGIPTFVLGQVLILVFALGLGWFSAGGFVGIDVDPVRHLRDIVLPAVTVSFWYVAVLTRMTRSSMLEQYDSDWVRTARGKGLSPGTVLTRHVLRNAMGPIATVTGLQIGGLLSGVIIVEALFNLPGLGSLVLQGAQFRDYPVVQGCVVVIAIHIVLVNLLTDVVLGILDPRISHA